MTKAQLSALKWLRNRGGSGIFERNRQVLVAMGDRAPVTRATWNALERAGLLTIHGEPRIRVGVTLAGYSERIDHVDESEDDSFLNENDDDVDG